MLVKAYEMRQDSALYEQTVRESGLIQAIRDFRKTQGLSLRKLAREMGVSYSYLSALENNKKNITKPFIKALKNYLIHSRE